MSDSTRWARNSSPDSLPPQSVCLSFFHTVVNGTQLLMPQKRASFPTSLSLTSSLHLESEYFCQVNEIMASEFHLQKGKAETKSDLSIPIFPALPIAPGTWCSLKKYLLNKSWKLFPKLIFLSQRSSLVLQSIIRLLTQTPRVTILQCSSWRWGGRGIQEPPSQRSPHLDEDKEEKSLNGFKRKSTIHLATEYLKSRFPMYSRMCD